MIEQKLVQAPGKFWTGAKTSSRSLNSNLLLKSKGDSKQTHIRPWARHQLSTLVSAQRVNNTTRWRCKGEVTRHRLTACNQEQRPSTPRKRDCTSETTIQTSPLGSQAQETRENGSLGEEGFQGRDKERLSGESSLNALLHNNTNLKGWLRAVPVRQHYE